MEEYPQPGPVEQVGLIVSRLSFPGGRQSSLFREVRSRDHLLEDIRQLLSIEKYGVAGFISGKAIYEGKFTVQEAVQMLEQT